MANAPYGLSSLVQTFAPSLANVPGSSPFTPVRVIDIILDDKNPNFKDQGAWDSIGTIQFRPVYLPSNENNKNNFLFAKPFFSNIKHYPLKNEIVFILFLPNQNTENTYDGAYYYIDTVNIWSSIHHNALPDVTNPENYSEEQKRDYLSTSAGASRRVTDSSTDIKLGNTFKEKANIHSLLPYEGDTIIEGRWGQSLRFGSTVNDSNIKNIWSSAGDNGDPITVIRNKQSSKVPKEGWIPVLEDINNDGSSIYIGSTQIIPIVVASTNQKSFNNIISPSTSENIILPDVVPSIPSNQTPDTADTSTSANPNPPPSTLTTSTTSLTSSEALSPSEIDEIEFMLPGDVVSLQQQQEAGDINLSDLDNDIDTNEESALDRILYYDVPFENQLQKVWCFIASSTMILNYAGVDISQNEIYNSNFVNKSSNLLDSVSLFRSKGFNISKTPLVGGPTGYNTLIGVLRNNSAPFILERKKTNMSSNGSHFVVVVGLTPDNRIIVNDPAGKKDQILTPDQLKSQGSYRIINGL